MADKTQVIITIKRFSSPLLAQKQQEPIRTMNLEDLQKKRRVRKRLHLKPALFFLMHRKQRSGLREVMHKNQTAPRDACEFVWKSRAQHQLLCLQVRENIGSSPSPAPRGAFQVQASGTLPSTADQDHCSPNGPP